MSSEPLASGEGRLGADLFAAKLRHALSSDLSVEDLRARAERDFEAVRAELVRVARGCGRRSMAPPGCPRTTTRSCARPGWPWPRAIHHRMACSTSAATRRLPSRPSCARPASSPARRTAAHHVDTRVPATVRRRLPVATGAARSRAGQRVLDHPARPDWSDERRESYPPRGERPDAPHPVHPRGDPRPLPAARLVEPGAVLGAGRLPERHVRGGLGGLHHADHDGRRLRRGRPRPDVRALEVLPALRHQHAPRHRHPRRRHERGGRHGVDGRGRLPGRAGGTRQVPARTPVLDPALDLLRGLARDVGPRPVRTTTGCRAAGAGAGGRRRAAARRRPGQTPGFDRRAHLEAVISHGSPPIHWVRSILLGDEPPPDR